MCKSNHLLQSRELQVPSLFSEQVRSIQAPNTNILMRQRKETYQHFFSLRVKKIEGERQRKESRVLGIWEKKKKRK